MQCVCKHFMKLKQHFLKQKLWTCYYLHQMHIFKALCPRDNVTF